MNSISTAFIETTVNRQHIVDSFAQFLYATKVVPPSADITNIQFGNLFGESQDEFTKIKIYTNKEANTVH